MGEGLNEKNRNRKDGGRAERRTERMEKRMTKRRECDGGRVERRRTETKRMEEE